MKYLFNLAKKQIFKTYNKRYATTTIINLRDINRQKEKLLNGSGARSEFMYCASNDVLYRSTLSQV